MNVHFSYSLETPDLEREINHLIEKRAEASAGLSPGIGASKGKCGRKPHSQNADSVTESASALRADGGAGICRHSRCRSQSRS